MSGAAAQVTQAFSQASSYANSATSNAMSFVNDLRTAVYTPPTIDASWTSIASPSLVALPSVPAMPSINFNMPGGAPTPLNIAPPTVEIDDFTESAPAVSTIPAPSISYGTAPTVPAVGAVSVPAAPTITEIDPPSYLSINTPSFAGVNLREDYLAKLEDIPELDLIEPTPYSYTPSADYTSALLEALKTKITSRLAGGTGLNPAVEQAIWDRARDRETKLAQGKIDDVTRQAEAFGFALPPGVLASQIRDATDDYHEKLSGVSRDIAIKQAELEQENLKQAIAEGQQLESRLIDYSLQMERIAFESAKTYAENALAIYNGSIEKYKALLTAYQTYASTYRTIIDAELAKVEVFKSLIQAEQAKAQINTTLVEQYKAEVQAKISLVEIFKAQVSAAQTLVEIERTKISAAGEQIKAYVAQINGETAKVEAYKAQVEAQATSVEIYRTKAQAFSAKVGAQAERARAELGRYTALTQAKQAEWEGYRAKIQGEAARVSALGQQSSSLLDAYRASAASIEAQAKMQTAVWQTEIKNYEAGMNYSLAVASMNNEAVRFTLQSRLDAAKTGAQVFAQLAGSAYGMVQASAAIQGADSMNINWSYNGEVEGKAPATISLA